MQIRVTADAGSPAKSIWRWVPSPGSKSTPASSQRKKYPLWFLVRVGTWLAEPSTTSSREDIYRPYASDHGDSLA